MQCSSGQYGVSDMQELMLAAGGATMHMFSAPPEGAQLHHQQHQQHHHYQQSLQQHEILELYHRQAGLQPEHHLSPPELQGTHILFGLHQPQQKTVNSHLPLSHQLSLGSESSAEVAVPSLAAFRSTSTTSCDHVTPQYIQPMLPSSRLLSTMNKAVEEYSDAGAEDADKGALSGSRWPRQETLTLLQIRSQMDASFRDSASKGSLWQEVSRKLYDAGYQRSAKKCKEKFENVHKYYKKTKDGRAEKQDGKTYRFHTELEAIHFTSQERELEADMAVTGVASKALFSNVVANSGMQQLEGEEILHAGQEISTGPNSSASTSCGNVAHAAVVEPSEQQICGNKRKRSSWHSMRAFFDNLGKQLMERQDALHKKFLEAIERREEERVKREEAYKRQEMARMNREQDLRAREQALAATRDAALIAFLHKVTGETLHLPEMTPSAAVAAPDCNVWEAMTPSGEEPSDMRECSMDANSRRWPKVEVLALINVRTSLEPRFQEAGPKAQLWEDVSSSMASLGFSRSGKRCKEKWENINKYYRKTKDNVGRKLRPETATKTCPYFHQLELLYERGILTSPNSSSGIKSASKLDVPQTSGEFLESTSKDDSQQTSTNPDYQRDSSVSFVHRSANVQTADDGVSMFVACSSSGARPQVCNGVHVHDTNTGGDIVNPKAEPSFLESAPINVNCDPSPHLSDIGLEQVHGHEEHMTNRGSSVLINEGTRFVREMLEIQQQHHHHHHQQQQQQLRLSTGHLFERHPLIANHNEHAADMEMQNSAEEQVIGMRMHQQEELPRLNHECTHRDNATLMALVHKLASVDGHPDFDLSSPASPE